MFPPTRPATTMRLSKEKVTEQKNLQIQRRLNCIPERFNVQDATVTRVANSTIEERTRVEKRSSQLNV